MQQRRAWVLGGSGAVGRFLLRRLASAGWCVTAPSRRPAPRWADGIEGLQWQRLDLGRLPIPLELDVDAVFGAGPLDLLVELLARAHAPSGTRVVALSSTSIDTKRESISAAERALAERLERCERSLRELADERGWRLALIRPTLIYGAGVDASLSPLRRRAQRWGWLPLPRACRGLRQPVHADDLAAAMLACVDLADLPERALVLPGGETLSFDTMLSRTLATCEPPARLLRLPLVPVSVLARMVSAIGFEGPAWLAPLLRSTRDLCVPVDDWNHVGLVPRGFQPERRDFDTGE